MLEEKQSVKVKTEKIVVFAFCVLVLASMLMIKIVNSESAYQQSPPGLFSKESQAIAYSGYRKWQYP